jgi:hypothetical protein
MVKTDQIASNTVLHATLWQSGARMLWLMQTTVARWVNHANVEALSRDRGVQSMQDRGVRQGKPPRMS